MRNENKVPEDIPDAKQTRAQNFARSAQYENGSRDESKLRVKFIAAVLENDSKQDIKSTVNIIDWLCFPIRKELALCTEEVIVSENAINYQNNTFPLLCFYFMKS